MSVSPSSIFRILLRLVLLAAGAFFVLVLVVSVFYAAEVKQKIIAELNRYLRTQIRVNDFDVSLLRHFPLASFEMKGVVAMDACTGEQQDTLLLAERISLQFNLAGLLRKDIVIRRLTANDGFLRLRIDENGRPNYIIWQTDTAASSASGAIDLSLVHLENMDVRYDDRKNRQDYDLKFLDARIAGKFSSDRFSLKAEGDLWCRRMSGGSMSYLREKAVRIDGALDVNSLTGQYRLETTHLRVAAVDFTVGGDFRVDSTSTFLNLNVEAREAGLGEFISLLPAKYADHFKEYKREGRFLFHGTVRGEASGRASPQVMIDFSVRDGLLQPKGESVALERLQFTGKFNSRNAKGVSELVIPSLAADLGGHPIRADLRFDDLEHPFLTLHATCGLDLGQVQGFIRLDTLASLSGRLDLDVAFAGKVRDLPKANAENLYKVQASGSVRLSGVSFRLKRNPLEFRDFDGSFRLDNNRVDVESLSGRISSSDLRMNGTFDNFITFLLIPNQPGWIRARMESSRLELDELLADKTATSAEDTSYKLKFNPRLRADLDVEVGKLSFRRFKAEDITGRILLDHEVITGRQVRFRSMNGSCTMDATIDAARDDSVYMRCVADIRRIDIRELFCELENFDQETMTDKNVKGLVSAGVQFSSTWTSSLVNDPAKTRSAIELTIENGELNDFAPLQPVAKYIHLSDLNHIRFSTLKNTISIERRKINIPQMEVQSSALNLSLSGVHDFDNKVDYRLQLLLSDVLGRKVKQRNSEFGEIEDDGLGRTRLFLTMKGPVDDPRIGYDRKGAGEKIRNDLAREKQTIKSMLKEEFGIFRKDTTTVPQKKKKEEMQVDWDNKEE